MRRLTIICTVLLVVLSISVACTSTSAQPTPHVAFTSTPSTTDIPTPRPTSTPVPTATATSTATPKSVPSPTPTGKPVSSAPKPAVVSGPLAPLIVRGSTQKPLVTLTFDSGAAAGSTATVLDILRENHIHTTFFVTGKFAEANPALIKRIVAEGHTIGSHSYSHPDMTEISNAEIVSQLTRTEETIKQVAGVVPKPYFRPPLGAYDNRLLAVLAQQGYKAVYWTLDSTDWRDDSTTESVRKRVIDNTQAGYIVVHHASTEKTAQALPSIIKELRAKGLQIVNLPELLGE
ncbi:MAG: polysaccharide deacetylase family protein [Chloroflexi bacterium]|nr:polysaccharide deacetylase family protein [Chloroflexota bacterium]